MGKGARAWQAVGAHEVRSVRDTPRHHAHSTRTVLMCNIGSLNVRVESEHYTFAPEAKVVVKGQVTAIR